MRLARFPLVSTVVILAIACTEGAAPDTAVPAELVVVSGDSQSTTVGTELPAPLLLRLVDADGRGMRDEAITFTTTAGQLLSATVVTDGAGEVRNRWILGTVAGFHELTARHTSSAGAVLTTRVVAFARAGVPKSIVRTAGNDQSATAGTTLPVNPAVIVRDTFNNGVPDVVVTFAVTSGGGSVSGATPATDSTGLATIGGWNIGTVAGTNTLSATVAGLSPVAFTAAGTPGAPAALTQLTGNGQTAFAGTAVALLPAVTVRDTHGNPVPGIAVSFQVTAGGGAVTGGLAVSDSAGVARVGSWTLGTVAGSNTLKASAAGLAVIEFTATGIAGSAATMTISRGDAQTAVAGATVPVPPEVIVRDTHGNPVSGVSVVFAVTGGGGSVTGAGRTTNAAGVAAVGSWRLGTTAGSNTLSASASGLSPATFTANGTHGPASTVVINAGNAQTATVNTVVGTAPSVKVVDAHGNAIADVPITFAAGSSALSQTATLSGTSASTNAAGIATLGSWKLGTGAGSYTLTASATGLAPATFTATAAAGPPDRFAIISATTFHGAPTIPLDQPPAIELRDSFDNPSPTAGVAMSAAITAQTTYGPAQPQSVTGGTATTDATGRATFGTLALDGSPGTYTLALSSGTLGSASITVQLRPRFVRLLMGSAHTCGMVDPALVNPQGANLFCWGSNGFGQLGRDATIVPRSITGSMAVSGIPGGTAGFSSCLLSSGSLFCWGRNDFGQLGDGTTINRPQYDAAAPAGAIAFASASLGYLNACALTGAGAAWCWGNNQFGQLGDASVVDRHVPTAVAGGHAFTLLEVGPSHHVCALKASGAAYCWGLNSSGQIGDGEVIDRNVPTAVSGGVFFASVTAGGSHSCGRTTGGNIYCWGSNASGQLGDGGTISRTTPAAIVPPALGLTYAEVSAGLNHTCFRTGAGAAYCFGNNEFGQLGNGTTTSSSVPVLVSGSLSFSSIDAGYNRTCGITTGGIAWCWGRNDDGALGDGTTTNRVVPVAVR